MGGVHQSGKTNEVQTEILFRLFKVKVNDQNETLLVLFAFMKKFK